MTEPSTDSQRLAEACAASLYARDPASQRLGMTLEEIRPGYARLRMRVRADMLNGHRTCHGGFLFTLADSAFAFACNTYDRVTVAQGAAIEFLAPAREDDLLSAEALERSRSGRTGVYDVTVSNQHGERIALFRGKSYQLHERVLEAATQPHTELSP